MFGSTFILICKATVFYDKTRDVENYFSFERINLLTLQTVRKKSSVSPSLLIGWEISPLRDEGAKFNYSIWNFLF